MNIKRFLIYKALDVLPNDIIFYIFNFIKQKEGEKICNILSKIYYDKVARNCVIYMRLREIVNVLDLISDNEVIFFLEYTKYHITYKYIIDIFLWLERLSRIHDYYRYKYYKISFMCSELLDNLISSRS